MAGQTKGKKIERTDVTAVAAGGGQVAVPTTFCITGYFKECIFDALHFRF